LGFLDKILDSDSIERFSKISITNDDLDMMVIISVFHKTTVAHKYPKDKTETL